MLSLSETLSADVAISHPSSKKMPLDGQYLQLAVDYHRQYFPLGSSVWIKKKEDETRLQKYNYNGVLCGRGSNKNKWKHDICLIESYQYCLCKVMNIQLM